MSRDIPERDWKVFKELREIALERLCEKILNEAKAQIEQPTKTAHEKYLNLFKLFENRDDDIARGFNDFRRSTAIRQLGISNNMGLLNGEELRRLTPETLHIVDVMSAAMPKD